MLYEPMTPAEVCELLGLPINTHNGWEKTSKELDELGELDLIYARCEIRKRENGCSELVIHIPFLH